MAETKTKKYYKCSRCHRPAEQDKIYIIDDNPVCAVCLYGKTRPFKIYPVGVVKNGLMRAKKGFSTAGEEGVSRIKLFESQKPFLYKLEEEKYYYHRILLARSYFDKIHFQ